MALTKEEVESIKEQLREQVQSLPDDRKAQALQQIASMSDDAIESLVKQERQKTEGKESKSIYRMIIDEDIDSIKIAETKTDLIVLDINPISQGHCLVIPKEPAKDPKNLKSTTFTLAKKISKRIEEILKAKSTEIIPEKKFGETIIHVIPVYDKPLSLLSPRQKTAQEELKKIGDKIKIVQKPKIPTIKKTTQKPSNNSIQLPKLKRHIP